MEKLTFNNEQLEGSQEVMQEFIHDRHAMEWIDD